MDGSESPNNGGYLRFLDTESADSLVSGHRSLTELARRGVEKHMRGNSSYTLVLYILTSHSTLTYGAQEQGL